MEKVGPKVAEACDGLDRAKRDERATPDQEPVQMSGFLKKHRMSMEERVEELLQRKGSLSDVVARTRGGGHEKQLDLIGSLWGASAFMGGDVDASADTDLCRREGIRPNLPLANDNGLYLGTEGRATTNGGTDVRWTDEEDEFIRDLVAEQGLVGTWTVTTGRLNAHFGTHHREQEVHDRWHQVVKAKARTSEERAQDKARLGSKSPRDQPIAGANPLLTEDDPSSAPRGDQDPSSLVRGTGGVSDRARPENDWTAERDAFLQGMVAYGGRQKWERKTAVFNEFFAENLTKKQVFKRWNELAARAAPTTSSSETLAPRTPSTITPSPSLGKMHWSTEEDKILLAEARRANRDWQQIAMLLPGRTIRALQCRFRKIRSQTSLEPSSLKPKGPTAISAKAKDRNVIAMGASRAKQNVIGQASQSPSSLAKQNNGKKRKGTGHRDTDDSGTEGGQQVKIPAMVSSTGRVFTHSLFLRTMPPPPQQQQQQQQWQQQRQQQGEADAS